jgi:ubiquinone/menaquinone biosynthesis C-methylase UbiE
MSASDLELRAWREAAEHWIRNADRLAVMTHAASEALIARLVPAPGQRLLDVAAGVGDPTLQLALLVGPSGHVTATDGVAEMLDCLRTRAHARALHHVTVLATSAEELEVPAAAYDGACSRFGAMFFADPPRALANMRRAVRPGGRLVLAVWGEREANPFFTLTMDALDDAGAPAASLPPGSKTVFEFADAGVLADLARAAGWQDVREERVRFGITLADTAPEDVLTVLTELSRKITERVALLDEAQRAAAQELVTLRARPFVHGGSVVFPAQVLLVSGTA